MTAHLVALTRPDLMFCPLPGSDRASVLQALAERLEQSGVSVPASTLYARLAEREELESTGIGSGVAIPHCKVGGISEPIVAVGLAPAPGIDFGAVDQQPVRLFFVLVSPEDAPAVHLKALAAISGWIQNGGPIDRMLASTIPESLFSILSEAS